MFFYHHLRVRGYPRRYLQAAFKFAEVTWERRSQILTRTAKKEGDNFFEMYRACVLTLRNAPEWPLLKERLDLRLTELIQSTCGDIFPPRIFLAQSNTPRLGSIIKNDHRSPIRAIHERNWAGAEPETGLPSQTGPEPEPDVASPTRTEREPTRPMLDEPGSELVPRRRRPEPDRTSPSLTEREPYTLRTRAGARPTTELSN